MKISIVDDNKINCYVLKELLSSESYIQELNTYTNPENFIEELRSNEVKPDVILTDIMMPKLDGYELTKIVKSLYPYIKVIGITALPKNKDIINKIPETGMETIIFKPYDMKLLTDFLKIKN